MRKIIAVLLALVILVSMSTTFAAGTSSDPLVSLSYLESDVIPEIKGQVAKVISAYQKNSDHEAQAERIYNEISARIIPEGYSFESSYVMVSAPKGSSVTLLTGGSFILISGDMNLIPERGEIINLNTAQTASENLSENVRYFAAENTVALYTATRDSICLINGTYALENGAVITEDINFSDLNEDAVGYKAAMELYERGILSTVSQMSFEPETEIIIDTLINSLWVMADRPDDDAKAWARSNDIWTYDDLEAIITHEELAYILYMYAESEDLNTDSTFDITGYEDYDDVTPEYREALAWAFENGILTGTIDSVLEPRDHTTRIQAAMAIYKLIEIIE